MVLAQIVEDTASFFIFAYLLVEFSGRDPEERAFRRQAVHARRVPLAPHHGLMSEDLAHAEKRNSDVFANHLVEHRPARGAAALPLADPEVVRPKQPSDLHALHFLLAVQICNSSSFHLEFAIFHDEDVLTLISLLVHDLVASVSHHLERVVQLLLHYLGLRPVAQKGQVDEEIKLEIDFLLIDSVENALVVEPVEHGEVAIGEAKDCGRPGSLIGILLLQSKLPEAVSSSIPNDFNEPLVTFILFDFSDVG